jgi:hypothetical protein
MKFGEATELHRKSEMWGTRGRWKGQRLLLFRFLWLCAGEDVFEWLALLVVQLGNRERFSGQHLVAHRRVVHEYGFDHGRLLQVGGG